MTFSTTQPTTGDLRLVRESPSFGTQLAFNVDADADYSSK